MTRFWQPQGADLHQWLQSKRPKTEAACKFPIHQENVFTAFVG
jgi:hypothetical protein